MSDIIFCPGFDFDCLSNLANNVRLQERRTEDFRL